MTKANINRKMKIGVYIPTASFFIGGGEIVPLMQARYIKKMGIRVEIITLKTKDVSPLFESFLNNYGNIPIKYIDPPNHLEEIADKVLDHTLTHMLYLSLTRGVSTLIMEQKYDIVISHYAPAVFSVPKNVFQALVLHGTPSEYNVTNDAAVKSTDKIIAVSKSVALGWQRLTGASDIEVIHNGIDEKHFEPKNEKEDIDILYIGRLIEIKGVQYLIRAIKGVVENKKVNSKLHVVIGGKGAYKCELEKLTKELNLGDYIQFIEYIPEEDKVSYYNRSKICVFPSYAKEGVLTTLLEAFSCGRAVITTDSCGMVDIVKSDNNGILVKPQNSLALENKIEELLNNPKKRASIGRNARNTVLSSWSWRESTNKLMRFITESYEKFNNQII